MKPEILSALAAVILLVLVVAAPALPQANTSTVVSDFPITPPDPVILAAIEACIGEAVDFHGTVHMVAHETDNPNGGVSVAMVFTIQNGYAVGHTTGTIYRALVNLKATSTQADLLRWNS